MSRTQLKAFRCSHCGDLEEDMYDAKTMLDMHRRRMCFHCNFWQNYLELSTSGDRRCVRVSHHHFYIGDESRDWPNACKGFGGARFKIRFTDGREVETTNLWAQGEIPQSWWTLLPDNAVFVQGQGISIPFGCTSVAVF